MLVATSSEERRARVSRARARTARGRKRTSETSPPALPPGLLRILDPQLFLRLLDPEKLQPDGIRVRGLSLYLLQDLPSLKNRGERAKDTWLAIRKVARIPGMGRARDLQSRPRGQSELRLPAQTPGAALTGSVPVRLLGTLPRLLAALGSATRRPRTADRGAPSIRVRFPRARLAPLVTSSATGDSGRDISLGPGQPSRLLEPLHHPGRATYSEAKPSIHCSEQGAPTSGARMPVEPAAAPQSQARHPHLSLTLLPEEAAGTEG